MWIGCVKNSEEELNQWKMYITNLLFCDRFIWLKQTMRNCMINAVEKLTSNSLIQIKLVAIATWYVDISDRYPVSYTHLDVYKRQHKYEVTYLNTYKES